MKPERKVAAGDTPEETLTRDAETIPVSHAVAELLRLAGTDPMRAAERIMAHLRSAEGCPWDRDQTFDSIRRHTLEEVYEVFDAIERRDWSALQDELGDLLLQVLFYAQMAHEDDRFCLTDVARSLNAKLIRRHPHIFADVAVVDSHEVKQNWDAIKLAEKRSRGGEGTREALLAEVPRSMPALMEARKLGSAAARARFDWPDAQGVFAKVGEELEELQAAHGSGAAQAAVEEELGDLLFAVVNLSRHLHIDAEMALRAANAKFRKRFRRMEEVADEQGIPLGTRPQEDLEALWDEAKRSAHESDGDRR